MKILLTGATGFTGSALIAPLLTKGNDVIALCHRRKLRTNLASITVKEADLASLTDLSEVLQNVECVIHTAARVHVMEDLSQNPLQEFRDINVTGSLNLAQQAAMSGVRRFIYISSIKVNGELTIEGRSFLETDEFIPSDPYGLSKYEAEKGLLEIAKETGMDVVIIRPPLVYGPGVKANFLSLMQLLNKGLPLPFGKVANKRSFVALENLVSFIIHCIDHPKAANEVFLISDGEDVSTTELMKKVAKAFGKKARLIPVPVRLMLFVAKLISKENIAERLFGSLQVDSSKAKKVLGWRPVTTMDEQLKKTADAYLNETSI